MKPFTQADPDILQRLFHWKKQHGEWLRYEITEGQRGDWIIHFFSVDHEMRDRHVFASFSGHNPEEMKRWALTQLATFEMN